MLLPAYDDGLVCCYQGDVLEVLRQMEDGSVDCVVTSPPYWGLRDYGVAGQLGLEPMLSEYLGHMVAAFREVRRVLKPSGTLWLNMGDCYATSPNGTRHASHAKDGMAGWNKDDRTFRDKPFSTISKSKRLPRGQGRWGGEGGNVSDPTLKPKDLAGQPWRLAFALQDDGWWLRSDIIWAKPNPMPESVRDRPTKAHEYIFLMTKAERYYYNADAIRQPFSSETKSLSFETMDYGRRDVYKTKKPDGWDTGSGGHGTVHREGREKGAEAYLTARGANSRDVWNIATQPYPEAHFATFPEELPLRCIEAGCPADGVVLDPFAGSGTTLAVAKRLDRSAVGIELNPDYIDLIAKRVSKEGAQMRLAVS